MSVKMLSICIFFSHITTSSCVSVIAILDIRPGLLFLFQYRGVRLARLDQSSGATCEHVHHLIDVCLLDLC